MSKFRFLISGIATTVVLLACSTFALAQTGFNQQTFVAAPPIGDDVANNCTAKGTPCATVNGALGKTQKGGTVFILTPLIISTSIVITDSVTLDGSAASGATQIDMTNAFAPAIQITLPAVFSNVFIKFLTLNGTVLGGTPTSSDGIRFLGRGALTVERCFIYDFGNDGINFRANALAGEKARLFVRDTRLTGNYIGGIEVFNLTGGGLAEASLDSVRMEDSFTGVGFNGGSRSRAVIRDSVASSNAYGGIFAQPTVHDAALTFDSEIDIVNTTVAFDYYGISSGGQPNTSKVRVGNSQVLTNFSAGLRVEGGCQLTSMGGNLVDGNGSGNTGIFNTAPVIPQ